MNLPICNFGPSKAGYLLAPSSRQDQEQDHRAERPAELLGATPDGSKLEVGEHSVALRLASRLRQILHRVCGDDAAPGCPLQQPVKMGVQAPGGNRGAAIDNGINHVEHVPAPYIADLPMLPCGERVFADQALYRVLRPVAGLVAA